MRSPVRRAAGQARTLLGRRVGRGVWWTALVGVAVLGAVANGLAARRLGPEGRRAAEIGVGCIATAALAYASWLRFQDRDRPGPLALIWPGLMGLTGLMDRWRPGGDPASLRVLLGAVTLAVALWFVVELGGLRGTPGPNRYGEDPAAGTGEGPGPRRPDERPEPDDGAP